MHGREVIRRGITSKQVAQPQFELERELRKRIALFPWENPGLKSKSGANIETLAIEF